MGFSGIDALHIAEVRALATALGSYDGATELDRGLGLLFIGLTATV